MQTIGLAALRALVTSRADIEYDTDRHTVAWLNAEINNAIRLLRGKLVVDGITVYATSAVGTLPTSPTLPEDTFATLALPVDCESVIGIDVNVGGEWVTLESIPLRERLMMENGQSQGVPEAWSLVSLDGGGVAAIHPVPQGSYRYRVWYMPVHTDLTETPSGDPPVLPSISVLPGYADFIAWTVVGVVAVKDDIDSLKRDAGIGAMNAYTQAQASSRASRAAPNRRRDTRGAREYYSSRGSP